MAEIQIAREQGEPYALCPNCQVRLELPELPGERWTVRSPTDIAYRLQMHMANLEREELRVVLLNAKNRVMSVHVAYQGNVSSSLVRVGELYREAVRSNASAIIIVHNHPSGDPTPSPDDLHLSAETLAAGRLLDIDLLDSIVIGRDGWVSLRDRGIAFDRPARSGMMATTQLLTEANT
jgi:DNA repair protein RadC